MPRRDVLGRPALGTGCTLHLFNAFQCIRRVVHPPPPFGSRAFCHPGKKPRPHQQSPPPFPQPLMPPRSLPVCGCACSGLPVSWAGSRRGSTWTEISGGQARVWRAGVLGRSLSLLLSRPHPHAQVSRRPGGLKGTGQAISWKEMLWVSPPGWQEGPAWGLRAPPRCPSEGVRGNNPASILGCAGCALVSEGFGGQTDSTGSMTVPLSDCPQVAGTKQHPPVAQSNLNFLLHPEGKTHTSQSVSLASSACRKSSRGSQAGGWGRWGHGGEGTGPFSPPPPGLSRQVSTRKGRKQTSQSQSPAKGQRLAHLRQGGWARPLPGAASATGEKPGSDLGRARW